MDTTTQLLRIEDIAVKLNVSQKSVRRYIHAGKIKSNNVFQNKPLNISSYAILNKSCSIKSIVSISKSILLKYWIAHGN